ncbi:hypothetical protein DHEL01_v212381 [Diaporthe helianthi]|uniref:Uncharacterized protein n=1 Tax=Diaporthe helianthi TaxID=158607 RepID=A0A2P5HG53_DIAHE|nr:hypothetical protein DHEL01_v212381 [Diaporthe helianthi]
MSTIRSLSGQLASASASAVPRSDALEYSILQGVEPFNTTFANAHLANFEGPVTEPAAIAATSELSTRASGNVYVCINANFQPACSLLHWNNDRCADFVNPWEDSISSWGPDPGVTCHVYEKRGCDESGRKIYNIGNPGISNLVNYQFNDIISSARCWY